MDLRSLRYAVVDVETTGTRVHGGDRIMEVAVVHLQNGEVTTAAEFLVNPQGPVHPWVSRLTGLRWEMLHEAPTFCDIADRVREALDVDVFVAHNVRFDWRFVAMELQRASGRGLRGPRLCTVKVARKVLPHLRRRNLDALVWHYEVPFDGRRHRAGPDARATARVLDHLLRDARRQDVDTWDQLQELLKRPRPAAFRSALPQPVRDEWVA
ncbi:MAG TPA: 3'-5' exonuclease [Gemmatimonadaceae bacterium]|nr:3'-5' exonuclease [Gemmatimonadaceae bacterium]